MPVLRRFLARSRDQRTAEYVDLVVDRRKRYGAWQAAEKDPSKTGVERKRLEAAYLERKLEVLASDYVEQAGRHTRREMRRISRYITRLNERLQQLRGV